MPSSGSRRILAGLVLAIAGLAAFILLPRWLCNQTAEITLQRCDVVNGEGRIHYDLVLPSASSLAFAWAEGGSDVSQVEVPPRWFPGWPRKESRILNVGALNRTKMKIKDEILAGLLEKSISLEWGKTYRMERGDRLQFSRWVLISYRVEHR